MVASSFTDTRSLRRRIGVCEIVPGGFEEEVKDAEEEDEVAIIVGSDTMKAIEKRTKRLRVFWINFY